jgi:hypothetical protein
MDRQRIPIEEITRVLNDELPKGIVNMAMLEKK